MFIISRIISGRGISSHTVSERGVAWHTDQYQGLANPFNALTITVTRGRVTRSERSSVYRYWYRLRRPTSDLSRARNSVVLVRFIGVASRL